MEFSVDAINHLEKFAIECPFCPSVALYFKITLIVCLSSFMIVTAYSFLHFRLIKKEIEYCKLLNALGVMDEEIRLSLRAVSQEYALGDYWIPVTFATAVCVLGFYSLLFGADMVSEHYGKPNMLLTGMVMKSTDEMQELRWQSQLVLCLAFTGAFIWSAQNIIRRLITGDLTPGTYYSSALRMVFASLVSLMLSYTLETLPTAGYTRESLPVIAFLSGMLPDNTFTYLKERVSTFIKTGMKMSHDLPLEMIEGINVFHKLRLSEVGIDNAQNLAEANLIELVLKTPFNPSQLIDWIAQAKLYVYFKDNIDRLRALGIRTVFDLHSLCDDEEGLALLAEEGKISKVGLNVVCGRLKDDETTLRLFGFRRKLSAMEYVYQTKGQDHLTG
jgi:hypothetical protein